MTMENFKNIIIKEAYTNKNIYFVYVDGAITTLFDEFRKEFPDRVINVGIAESEAISIASGLALTGKSVYVIGLAQYVSARAYEQVRMDCAYNNANVKILAFISGLSSSKAGYSHWAIEDLNLMSNLPNMTVCCPGSDIEFSAVFKYSLKHKGPMYISWNTSDCSYKNYDASIGKISTVYDGRDFALITYGADVQKAVLFCEKAIVQGLSPMLLSSHTLKPFDEQKINEILKLNIPIITLEEHLYNGSLSSKVSEIIATKGFRIPFLPIYIKDHKFNILGSVEFLRKELLNVNNIEESILSFVSKNISRRYRIINKKYTIDSKKRINESFTFLGLPLVRRQARSKIKKFKLKNRYYLFGFIPIA